MLAVQGGCGHSVMWPSTVTRPDISKAVLAVARHSHSSTVSHWKAVLKIMANLRGTRGMGLTFFEEFGIGLTAYSGVPTAPISLMTGARWRGR